MKIYGRPRLATLGWTCALLLAGWGCRGGCSRGIHGDGRQRQLSPLPQPPPLQLAPDALGAASGDLTVVAARPEDAVEGEVRPTITFNKPVQSLATLEDSPQGGAHAVARIEPALQGEWRWLGSASVEFVARAKVPYATEYTVTVPKGLRALDGSVLQEDYTFKFHTPSLALQSTMPRQGDRWLTAASVLQLLFNQPVPVAALNAAATLEVEGEAAPRKVRVLSHASVAEELRLAKEKAKREGKRVLSGEDQGDEQRGENRQEHYEVKPEGALPLGRRVVLHIAQGLRPEQGPLGLDKEDVIEFRTYGPLKLDTVRFCEPSDEHCSEGPLLIYASNPLEAKSLTGNIMVTPAVRLDWDHVQAFAGEAGGEPPHVELPGEFKPGTRYRVQVGAGVRDAFGQGPGEALDSELHTDDLEPQLWGTAPIALVEGHVGPKLPLSGVNLKSLDVQLWALTLAEAATAFSRPPWSDEARITRPANARTRMTFPTAHRNERHPINVDLTPVFHGKRNGLALVRVQSPEVETHGETHDILVQVTDLAVHAEMGASRSAAWVTRISTGAPVPGAQLQLVDKSGTVRASAQTDAEGLADLPGLRQLPKDSLDESSPFVLVTATLGEETGVTTTQFEEGIEPYEFSVERGSASGSADSASLIFTERGIYRPGEEVFFKGVFRNNDSGQLVPPRSGTSLELVLTTPKDEKLRTFQLKTSRFGTVHGSFVLPKEAALGFYSLRATGKGNASGLTGFGGFRVAEYRAPQFKVDVELDRPQVVAGERIEGKAFARYLFGAPMRDAPVHWSLHRETGTFSPDGFPGFSFAQETWWWDDANPEPSNEFVSGGTAVVDAQGKAALEGGLAEAPGDHPWNYVLEAEVQDVNRQTVANRARVLVHPAAFYVGIKPPSGFPESGKEVALDTVVTDVSGKRVVGRALEVKITRRSWKSIQKRDATGGLVTESEPVEEAVAVCALQSASLAVPCRFRPQGPGFYIAKASVRDDAKRAHVASMGMYVIGEGWVAWQRADNDRIELLPEKTTYDIGETARVLVKSPYPEAEALVTVEREGVLSRRHLHLKGAVSTVEVPISEEMVPNVYVSVLLVHPRTPSAGTESGADANRPGVKLGLAKLGVERKSKRLAVQVASERPAYRPGEEVRVAVRVQDAKGKPAAAEVAVFAVDEGVLRLTDYRTPDLVEAMFQERPLRVWRGEPLLYVVGAREFGEKGESAGGGGGEDRGPSFRSDFRSTAAFIPAVETDADGKASVHFKLPDNLTTFRVMAVVVGERDRFGSGETSLEVNKPLLAMPALPRFARVGDHFEAGVVVHRHGGAPGEVLVRASTEGLRLSGPAEHRVNVVEGAPQEVRFNFTAEQVGVATLRFTAESGEDRDGVEQKLPVELPVTTEAVATVGDTRTEKTEGIEPPRDVWPGIGGLEVSLASTALGNFQQGMQALVEYPYGCLEQQSSRLVPFVALREISGAFGLEWPGPNAKDQEQVKRTNAFLRAFLLDPLDVSSTSDPDEVIRKTLASLSQLQNEDGSFRYWSSSSCSDSWSSAYATLTLTRAKQVGFSVDPAVLANAQAFLARVAGGTCAPCELICPLETQVFASYVLARAGRPKASTYSGFFAHRQELPLFARALLADAMFLGGGDQAQAKALLKEILNHAKESPRDVHFEEVHSGTYVAFFHSDVRTTGAVLQLLTDLSPEHPFVGKMAAYLTGARRGDGRWRNTQEAAFSLMALSELLRTKERAKPHFKASVALGGQPLIEESFEGRSMAVKVQHLPLEQLQAKLTAASAQPLVFRKQGDGTLYYSATLTYVPKVMPTQSMERGLFVQRWFEPIEGGGQSRKFYAGDLVRVRLRVGSPQERHWAAFEIPLPAGLEAVDTSLASTAQANTRQAAEGDAEDQEGEDHEDSAENPWAHSFWSPFNHVERRDSRVVYFADHLPPGVHVASFVARATTPGSFILRPAKGELMYEPEVFGRTEGGSFEVLVAPQVAGR